MKQKSLLVGFFLTAVLSGCAAPQAPRSVALIPATDCANQHAYITHLDNNIEYFSRRNNHREVANAKEQKWLLRYNCQPVRR